MNLVLGVLGVFVLAGFVGYAVSLYNGLIRLRHNIDKSWANIDVLLKQRHDEIPKLIDTCKGYMKHEKNLLEKITQARTEFLNANSIEGKTDAENHLAHALKTLFAVSENYPDLKANQNFLQLQGRISILEDQISDRREFVNDSANLYNIRIEQFPDVFFARGLSYVRRPLLEIPKADTKDVTIKF